MCVFTGQLFLILTATQETYDDTFFEALDGVANALDNVDASESMLYNNYNMRSWHKKQ